MLGGELQQALRDSTDPRHQALRSEVEARTGPWLVKLEPAGDTSTIDLVHELKTYGKNQRDRNALGEALTALRRARDLAERAFDEATTFPDRKDMATELSDIFGIMGGIERRRERYRRSAEYYESGLDYESEDYGVIASYNLVNRIVSRLLDDPGQLSSRTADEGTSGTETSLSDDQRRSPAGAVVGDPRRL